jgi:hypothetical protein
LGLTQVAVNQEIRVLACLSRLKSRDDEQKCNVNGGCPPGKPLSVTDVWLNACAARYGTGVQQVARQTHSVRDRLPGDVGLIGGTDWFSQLIIDFQRDIYLDVPTDFWPSDALFIRIF